MVIVLPFSESSKVKSRIFLSTAVLFSKTEKKRCFLVGTLKSIHNSNFLVLCSPLILESKLVLKGRKQAH